MRVCHVCSGHPDNDGRVFERACISLVNAGYETHLIAQSTRTDIYRSKGVIIHPLNAKSRGERWRNIPKIAQMASKIQADLYHVHEPELLGPILWISKNRPVIWDVHEPYVDYLSVKTWIPKFLRPLIRKAWDQGERLLVKRCGAVITVADSLAERYQSMHNKVVVVRNFPRLDYHASDRDFGAQQGSLVFTGVLAPNRGIQEVIQAMGILKQKSFEVSLHLAGIPCYPSYTDELMSEAKRQNVNEQVHYHGILSQSDALALQKNCSIGLNISNSRMYPIQGYPVKMFEFMYAGLPVIYSNSPSFLEIAGTSNAGIGVDPGNIVQIADAIETLVQNPDLARSLGENGRKSILEKYNWDLEWYRLRDLYIELIGSPTSQDIKYEAQ